MDTNAVTRRWFHPTPAWLVWGAAVATGVLFACERWRWFPVGCQKGWPVVAAVAVVAAVLVLILAWMLVALLFRRRMQFGLRTMLVFVTLCAVVCSWLAVRIKQARRQAEVVSAIREKLGVAVWYDNPPGNERPAIKPLGIEFFADVDSVALGGPQVTDEALADIARFTRLKWLYIEGDQVTDSRLTHLEGLTNLVTLKLIDTKVTDEAVRKLQRVLPDCEMHVDPPGQR